MIFNIMYNQWWVVVAGGGGWGSVTLNIEKSSLPELKKKKLKWLIIQQQSTNLPIAWPEIMLYVLMNCIGQSSIILLLIIYYDFIIRMMQCVVQMLALDSGLNVSASSCIVHVLLCIQIPLYQRSATDRPWSESELQEAENQTVNIFYIILIKNYLYNN